MGVVFFGVEEFVVVIEVIEVGVFVVFVYVGCYVCDGDGVDVGGGFDGVYFLGGGVGVFLDV